MPLLKPPAGVFLGPSPLGDPDGYWQTSALSFEGAPQGTDTCGDFAFWTLNLTPGVCRALNDQLQNNFSSIPNFVGNGGGLSYPWGTGCVNGTYQHADFIGKTAFCGYGTNGGGYAFVYGFLYK